MSTSQTANEPAMPTRRRCSGTANRRNGGPSTPTAERLGGRFVEIERDDSTGTGVGPRAAREARLPSFLALSEPAGPRLDAYRAMLVGVGSVNANLALHCARLQIGELWLVDPGRLKPESVLTHPVAPSGVGIAKVEYFGRLVKAISPGTRVFAFPGPVQSLSLGAMERVDVVAMAADNLAAEVETGQRCLHHGKPLVQASVHGDTLVAQARFWRNDDGAGPCPACGFGRAEWDHVNAETTFSCTPHGHRPGQAIVAPTMSCSFLCSIAADLAMTLLARHALGLGPPLEDAMIEYSGYPTKVSRSPLARNPACPCEHAAWGRAAVDRPLGGLSLARIAESAGVAPGTPAEELSFTVDDLTFVDRVVCCGRSQPVRRFARADDVVARCPHCGAALRAPLFHAYRPTPGAVLSSLVERPLARLGAAAAGCVAVRHGERTVLCQRNL